MSQNNRRNYMADETLARVKKWLSAWNSGNLDPLDEVFAPDSLYHVPPFPDLPGLPAHKQFIQAARITYPDFHIELTEIIHQEDRSAVFWTWSGTFSGPSQAVPTPPTGKFGQVLGCHILHWEGGKIKEAWHIGDWLGLLTQHGVFPQPA
jgi:predicted ester cyclase